MKMRKLAATVLTTGLAVTALMGAAAGSASATTYPVNSWYASSGASNTGGTLTWYNRSVGISGADRAEGGECRATEVLAFSSSGAVLGDSGVLGLVCVSAGGSAVNNTVAGGVDAPVAGGAAYVIVYFLAGTPTNWSTIATDTVGHA
jgi:hypothetical protein